MKKMRKMQKLAKNSKRTTIRLTPENYNKIVEIAKIWNCSINFLFNTMSKNLTEIISNKEV